MFETEVHNISIIVRSVGSIIVCASCMFGIPQQSWAGNKFVAAVLVAAHQYFFALSLPGNITQKGVLHGMQLQMAGCVPTEIQ